MTSVMPARKQKWIRKVQDQPELLGDILPQQEQHNTSRAEYDPPLPPCLLPLVPHITPVLHLSGEEKNPRG